MILFDNIPARSFALLSHRLPSSQPLAYIIARLRLASLSLVPLILSDNIPARSFALLTHRLPSSQPLAYIIARLRLASLRSMVYSYQQIHRRQFPLAYIIGCFFVHYLQVVVEYKVYDFFLVDRILS